MTTLNARANQAWREGFGFSNPQDAFEEGWETGYKTAVREVSRQIEEEIPEVALRAALIASKKALPADSQTAQMAAALAAARPYLVPAEDSQIPDNVVSETEGSNLPRGDDPRDFMAVHWHPCDTRLPYAHPAHWVETDQEKLVITNCPGRNEHGGTMVPPFPTASLTAVRQPAVIDRDALRELVQAWKVGPHRPDTTKVERDNYRRRFMDAVMELLNGASS